MLAKVIRLDATAPDALVSVLGQLSEDLEGVDGRTMGELLLDELTDVAVVTVLKDYGKELIRRRAEGMIDAAATLVYYAAIANALVFHDRKISQHSYEYLDMGFAKLAAKPWVSPELRKLLARARSVCRLGGKRP